MRFLKAKYIIPSLLVIVLVITLLVYFVGGLSSIALAEELKFTNKEVNMDDFVEASSMETFDNNKKFAENDNFEMFIDEATTKITIVDKRTGKSYTTTNDDLTSVYGSNFSIFYYGANGTQITTGLNTMTDSVNFYNKTSNTYEKHYALNYIDGGVQIAYDIGRFTQTYYPDKMRIEKMINQFIGNIRIAQEYANVNIIDSFGNTMSIRVVRYKEYHNSGTYSASTSNYDVAKYIYDNNYGDVNPLPDEVDPENPNLYFNITYLAEEFVNGWGTTINAKNFGEEGASPCIVNPFIYEGTKNSLFDGYYKIETDEQANKEEEPDKYRFYKLKATSSTQFTALFNLLYDTTERHMVNEKYVYDASILDDQDKIDELVAAKSTNFDNLEDDPKYYLARKNAGYAARDEGGFLYEDGLPVPAYYSIEEAYHENQYFGVEGDLVPVRFRVGMEVSLAEDYEGVKFKLLGDVLREGNGTLDYNDPYSHNYRLSYIDFLPYFTYNDEATSEGMLVVPDGSGAVIKFNNGAQELNYNDFRKRMYGRDMNIAPYQMPDSDNAEKLMFPMYGYIDTTNQMGVVGVIANGANSSILDAGTLHDNQRGKPYNHAKFQTYFREMEEVAVGTNKWNTSKFNKWSATLNTIDFEYDFIFLKANQLSYPKVAEIYREYLINKYLLEAQDTSANTLVDVNFLGAYERYILTLGVKHKIKSSLTTFKQAQEVLEELMSYDVHNLSVSYRGWSEDALEPKARSNHKIAKILGGTKDFNVFKDFLYENNIDFYPEINVTTNKGYDYSFGNLKYTGKSIGASYSTHYPYNLATKVQDKRTYIGTNYVSAKYYTALVDSLLPSFKKLKSEGVYAIDLGNVKVSDYQRGAEVYAEVGCAYQKQALGMFKEEIGKVKLSAPFEYALSYVDYAVDVPIYSSQNPIIDYMIPFYQLVVSGLFDYTGPAFNLTGDEQMELLKMLETGSNLQFVFSYEDPKILYDTRYNRYPQTYYANWKAKVINTKETLDTVGIHGGRLINHELVGGRTNVVKVLYSNGVEILINKSLTADYVDSISGITVKAKSYLVLSGGH